LKPTEKQIHKKNFIDTNKLNNNVLEVRYNKNRHLTGIKTQIVGNGVKSILNNIIDNDNMDEKEYHNLTENEKHLIRTVLSMLEKSHLIKNKDETFNQKFQILLGSYNAGNNSEILKNQLRQYIIHAMKLKIISRNTGNAMLLELSL
jgi:transcription initiation factor IIE alpha subunit